jgi:hypothetical protein
MPHTIDDLSRNSMLLKEDILHDAPHAISNYTGLGPVCANDAVGPGAVGLARVGVAVSHGAVLVCRQVRPAPAPNL